MIDPALALKKAMGLARFRRSVRGFLDEIVTVAQARARIEQGVRMRESRFLDKLRTRVFGDVASPYRQLFDAAGCGLEDARELVEAHGLEGALQRLAAAGVYVRYEEFKGREPAVRGSRTFDLRPEEFDDPLLDVELVGSSGGSRGKPTAGYGSIAYLTQMVPHWAVFFAENDCLDKPLTFWTPGHSGATSRHLWCAKFGCTYRYWFLSEEMTASKDRLYAWAKRRIVEKECGFAPPIRAPYDQPEVLLDYLLPLLESGGASLNTAPSAAVKLCRAAEARGSSLDGLTFLLGAEPLTAARKTAIESAGARATPLYGASEATWIGGQCRNPAHPDEVHVLRDNYGLIPAPDSESEEDAALLLTTLQPLNQKILINVDIGDRAVVGSRRCGCLYDQMGCTTTLHSIRSSDKITEYGVNFAVSDVFRVLEDAMPRRFGGAAGDYQLLEWRDADSGLPRYTLRVAPRTPERSASEIEAAFLDELGRMKPYYGYMTAIFRKEKALQVERADPVLTGRGKLFPFHRLRDRPET